MPYRVWSGVERKVALIPRVIAKPGLMDLGPKEYGYLLTDARSILVLELESKSGLAAGLGGAVGAAIARSLEAPRQVGYYQAEPDDLTKERGTITIPHDWLNAIFVRKSLIGGYRLRIEYTSPDSVGHQFEGELAPARDTLRRAGEAGIRAGEMVRRYAEDAGRAIAAALPPARQSLLRWES